MSIAEYLNSLSEVDARNAFEHCCTSSAWIGAMLGYRPFDDERDVFEKARLASEHLSRNDWLEAFAGHPRIGDINSLRAKYASTRQWASGEQSGVNVASEETLHQLARCNDLYFERYGYIFIVCATGKSADEMLSILKSRLNNDAEAELSIAAEEQRKITDIRLRKLGQQA